MATQLENVSEETRDQLAQTMLLIGNNAKTRKTVLGAIKTVNPSAIIPELDEPARFEAELAKRDQAVEKLSNDFRDYRLTNELTAKKSQAMEKFGLAAEDMTKVEGMMAKGELPTDYTWAAQLYNAQKEPAAPTSYGNSGYGPLNISGNAKAFEGLMDDESNWSISTAHAMIDEMHKKGQTPSF